MHSDRGGIYGDDEYMKKGSVQRLRRSMSRMRNPWDNAVIERLCSTPSHERLDRKRIVISDGAQRSISE